MNHTYLVSIIIPIYNVAGFIEKSTRSLLSQTFESIQYIFIDDASTDSSLNRLKEIIQEFPNRIADIEIVENKINLGSSSSRNIGLEKVLGKYITFCDADDFLDENGISEMYQAIELANSDILWTDFYFTFEETQQLSKQTLVEDNYKFIMSLLQEKIHGALWNKLYRYSLFKDNNIQFVESRDMWEDLYINIRLFHYANKITYLAMAFYHYVQFNNASLGTKKNSKKLEDILFHCNAIIDFLKNNSNKSFARGINSLKFASKQTLLFSLDINEFKNWAGIYPEVNNQAFQSNRLPIHLKAIAWLTSKKMWGVIKLWINIKSRKQ